MTFDLFLNAEEHIKKLDESVYNTAIGTATLPTMKCYDLVWKRIVAKWNFVEEYERCLAQINNLTAKEKWLLILRYKRQLSLAEVSELTNIKISSLSSIIRRIINKCYLIKFPRVSGNKNTKVK